MKVQDVKNVCIVCPPLVVIVHPVEEGETQSDQFVAYDIITTPDQPANPGLPAAPVDHPPPQPPPSQFVPADHPVDQFLPEPHPPFHQAPAPLFQPPPPPQA